MSRKELAMIFVIATAATLLPTNGAANPFSAELSQIAMRIVETNAASPTNAEIMECIAYIKAHAGRA